MSDVAQADATIFFITVEKDGRSADFPWKSAEPHTLEELMAAVQRDGEVPGFQIIYETNKDRSKRITREFGKALVRGAYLGIKESSARFVYTDTQGA